MAADMEAVSRGLDAYARHKGLSPGNIVGAAPSAPVSAAAQPSVKRHEFEAGIERYRYVYQEMVNGEKYMNTKGFYNGVVLAYTFRPLDVDSVSEIMNTIFRAEVRYALGRVDYTGTGNYNGLDDRMYELRALVGQEIGQAASGQIVPYAGLAMRYLHNGLSEYQPGGYDRRSEYFYVPVGIEMRKMFSRGWGLGLGLEYDFFCSGEQTSHLGDTGYAVDTLTNKQRKGYGWRAGLRITKEWARVKLVLEPYYRYWHIRASDIEFLTSGGALIPDPYDPGYFLAGQEPDNTTREAGVKMGIVF